MIIRISNILLVFVIVLTSCNSKQDCQLYQDEVINDIFTEIEIEALCKIITYFDSFILTTTNSNHLDSAYHNYCENLKYSQSYEELYTKLVINEVEKEQLLDILKEDGIFDNLYLYEYSSSIDMDTVAVLLTPNHLGKYMTLVNFLAGESEYFTELQKIFESAGGPVERIAIGLPNGHHLLDFNDDKIRLITAINILSLDAPEMFSTQQKVKQH